MLLDMCSCRRAPLSTAFDKSALTVIRKLKAQNFGTILDFVPVLLVGVVLFKILTASESCEQWYIHRVEIHQVT
jgi:hypothetical protein